MLNASPLEVNFLDTVGEGYWEVGDGCAIEWKCIFFFFFFAEVGFYSFYFIIVTEI